MVMVEGSARAESLREALVTQLTTTGRIRSAAVKAAFTAVPRHLFAPEVPLEQAYADDSVRTKRNEDGVTISSVSAPWLQAMMLEQAAVRPGMRCLEIGSGGYNAALLAELVGPAGAVTTVDIDPDVTDRASRCLSAAGYDRVRVQLADAEAGVPDGAPWDRIIVTVGMWDIPPAWAQQLAADGRLVVPLRIRGLGRAVVLVPEGDHLVSLEHEMAGFVAVQGAGAHSERLVTLHGDEAGTRAAHADADVGLRFDDDQPADLDVQALRTALAQPRTDRWSGVLFGGMESFDGLMLWLASELDGFGMLSRARTDAARALVDPASPTATPTLVTADGFAYLSFRDTDHPDTYEFGAYAHGRDAAELAARVVDLIRAWDADHRAGPPARIQVYPAATPASDLPSGRAIGKKHSQVVITWP